MSSVFSMARTGSPPHMRGKEIHNAAVLGILGITPASAGKRWHRSEQAGRPGDQPRVCEEKPWLPKCTVPQQESPPHMRGKVSDGGIVGIDHGITPTYAGKSCCPSSHLQRCWDHPRICGEKFAPSMPVTRITGSPPTYAGKREPPPHKQLGAGDHPRICGEKRSVSPVSLHTLGSPPHMRGKAAGNVLQRKTLGITPAYAGKGFCYYPCYGVP